MSGQARSTFRRTKRTAVAVATATLLTFLATDPGAATTGAVAAEEAFGAGRGTAVALAYTVNPVFGNLSFGITAGESVAGHQNTGAQAQSKAVNLGIIGLTLAGEGCEGSDPTLPAEQQPQPVIVGSDDQGAAEGHRANLAEVITQFARATKAPFAEAVTTVAPLGDAALAEIRGARAIASSGVVAPGVREAKATTHLAEVRLLGGLVTLGDLRWDAVQRTGARDENRHSFSIGSLHIAGTDIPLPTDALGQLSAVTDALRDVVGIQVAMPELLVREGVVSVSPLKIGVVPAEQRDNIIGGLIGELAPLREQLTDLIAELSCGGAVDILGGNNGTLITVLDLVLGTASGAGATNLELGGVTATTAAIDGFQGLGEFTPVETPSPTPDLGGGPGFVPQAPVTGPFDLPPTVDVGSTDDTGVGTAPSTVRTTPVVAFQGQRGGALLGVGIAGLLALLAAAEMDRRKMRRAQRAMVAG